MNTEDQKKTVSDAWRTAASSLAIRVEAPYVLVDANHAEVSCIAYLPDFGGSKGMVIGPICNSDYKTDRVFLAATSRGLYCSLVNAEVYEHYEEATFKEALTDWGFFGDETRRPSWLQKPSKSE